MNIHLIHSAFIPGKINAAERPEISRVAGILFLLSFFFVYMGSQAQTITLNKKRMPASKLIAAIQEQSGYNIFYASGLLDEGKKTDVTFEKVNLTQALDAAVSKQPYIYELIGKTIVLKSREENKANKGSSLKGNDEKEEPMVNTGYQKFSKKQSTGSSSEVSREDIERNSSSTMLDLLRKLPGVMVQGSSIKIRGATSILLSTDPLILVDGVPYPTTDINSLDPNMIQNITVLKDAAETALYGSRGGNGVIVIATRQGGRTNQNNDLGSINLNSDGSILFTKANVTVVMKIISQWYKILVNYESKSPQGSYNGRLTIDITYDEMIQILQSAGITLKQEGRNIVVSG